MNHKKNKSKSKKNNIKKNKLPLYFLSLLIITIIASALSYYLMKKESPSSVKTDNILENKKEIINIPTNEIKTFEEKTPEEYFDELNKTQDKHEKFEEYTKEFDNIIIEKDEATELINKENEEVLKKVEEIKEDKKKLETIINDNKEKEEKKEEPKEIIKEIKEVKKVIPIDEKNIITKKDTFKYNKDTKAKLVILIDDVSTKAQKDKILNIGYTVNMAFLPPTKTHKDSASIAQNLPFYMIHFPMQASSAFKGEEINTLKITDSYETIEKRVKQLRDWYPNAIYTNNHTGSVFTENEEAVDKLFRALKKYNFIFVDSRTSAKSVIKKYAKKYDMPYIVRNTFIDNDRDYKSIQTQLIKAIEIAKKQGYAIAIGHPHDITLKVLKESKHLLKDVEPIYMNKLPYL
ncbi:divergent polysaccharide deacetylase [Arcobacter acticola]|jgi:uncharacterized protein|uniref:Divergent polysaccharide deacetylase n=2 Tax=Arcobacter acticola TaxID=1849015 RepID=A0A6M8EWI6_9BACT|nr:divergent polysaccharide deacetylase [Arcobacter acticola]